VAIAGARQGAGVAALRVASQLIPGHGRVLPVDVFEDARDKGALQAEAL